MSVSMHNLVRKFHFAIATCSCRQTLANFRNLDIISKHKREPKQSAQQAQESEYSSQVKAFLKVLKLEETI